MSPVTPEEPKMLYQNWDDEYVITAGSTGVYGFLFRITPVAVGRPTMQLCGANLEGFPCIGLGSVGGAGAAGTRCEFRIHGIAAVSGGAAVQSGASVASDANGQMVTHPGAGNTSWRVGITHGPVVGVNNRASMMIARNYIA